MNVLIESEHTLVIQDKGRKILTVALMVLLPIMIIHLGYLAYDLKRLHAVASAGWGWAAIIFALIIYACLFYLASGPMRDIVTVTFHGIKSTVTIERTFPFGLSNTESIPFADIEKIVLSSPDSGGEVKLEMKDGKSVALFRARTNEEFQVARRLDVITRKKIEVA